MHKFQYKLTILNYFNMWKFGHDRKTFFYLGSCRQVYEELFKYFKLKIILKKIDVLIFNVLN
jgi:hypothetical protein